MYLGNDYEVETDGSSTTTRRYDDAGGNKVAEMRYKAYGETRYNEGNTSRIWNSQATSSVILKGD